MRRKRTALWPALILCLLLTGCGVFPDPLSLLPWGEPQEEPPEPQLLLGPGLEEEGLPGAEWSVFAMMRRPGGEAPQEDGAFTAYVPSRTPIFDAPYGETRPGETVAGGTFLRVEPGEGLLWFAYGGGWLYGEDLYPVINGAPGDRSISETLIEERFLRLERKLPEGSYWNHYGRELPQGVESPFSVTQTPCEHMRFDQLYCNQYNGRTLAYFPEFPRLCQCLGYASLLSDQLFGEDAPLYLLPEDAPLRPGDHLRLREYEHSVVVREVTEEGLRLAEVNAGYEDCLISWQRAFTWQEWRDLYGWDVEAALTRYPLLPTENGWAPLDPQP